MQFAVITFDGSNEIDSFIAAHFEPAAAKRLESVRTSRDEVVIQ